MVLLPMFDHTCGDTLPNNTPSVVGGASPYGCTRSGLDSGVGSKLWYRIPQFAAFLLTNAYTNGNHNAECEYQSNQCLLGRFVNFVVSGQVGPSSGGGSTTTSVIGVQLIK